MNELPVNDRLRSCDPTVAVDAALEVLNGPTVQKEPLELMNPSMVLFQNGKQDEAVFWYYAAELRTRYQLAFQNGDRGQLLTVMRMTVGSIITNHALKDTTKFRQVLDRVLEWDRRTANPFRDSPQSPEVKKKIADIYAGLNELKAKLTAEKDKLEADARRAEPQLTMTMAQAKSGQCRPGQLDPAFEAQETEIELKQLARFVRNNREIIQAAGATFDVSPGMSAKKRGELMPSRYEAYVSGQKKLYAIVDVFRGSGEAKFSLACITQVSPGNRQVGQDPCKQ